MTSPQGKRITELRKFLDLTQIQIAALMETSQNMVSLIENGKNKLTEKQISHLTEKIHVNRNWLETGEGDMFISSSIPQSYLTKDQIDKILTNSNPSPDAVPFFDIPVEGIPSEERPAVKYMIDYPPFNDCTFYRPIYGESMTPRFKSGDTVACKKISRNECIIYGEVYLCVFKYGEQTLETIRSLRMAEDKNMISLVPLNPNYDSITIPRDSIEELYLIKGKIERFV